MAMVFEYRRFGLELRHPVRTAAGTWTRREGVFVRVTSEDGSVGYGEAAPLREFTGEAPDEVEAFCASLGTTIDSGVLERVPGNLASAANALRQALIAPLAPQRTSLAVAALLPAGRPAFDRAPALVDAGFRTFKWKVGVSDARDELAMLDDLASLLPSTARIRLDANGSWDRRTAEYWLSRLPERPVEFVEQPVARDARGAEDLLRGLASFGPVPLALDESVSTDLEVERWLGQGWSGYFVVKPLILADPARVLSILERARARVVFSSCLETALGARSSLAHAFAWTGSQHAVGFGVWPLFANTLFDGPAVAPFLRPEDAAAKDPENLWNAIS